MISCQLCGRGAKFISRILPYCSECIREQFEVVRQKIIEVHRASRAEFGLITTVPETKGGIRCSGCVNKCLIGEGEKGFCGIRENRGGRIVLPDQDWTFLDYYFDPLPTNCVAGWICPGCSTRGFPAFSHFPHPEYGYKNLAVFYEGCTFDCLFCQNWTFKKRRNRTKTDDLVRAVDPLTSCICYFGGDPAPFALHSLEVGRKILEQKKKIFRVCWETNGSLNPELMRKWANLALESGGCIKIDFKAFSEPVHYALCGSSNWNTKENIRLLADLGSRRTEPPLLVISTLLVPGYIDDYEIENIARFIAGIDPAIPWSLLAFHPQFLMTDLPCTPKTQAEHGLKIAQKYRLREVNIGNVHLLT